VRICAALIPIARRERGLQNRFHRGDKRLRRILQQQRATAPQQMRQTCLMGGMRKLPVRLPPVPLQDAGIVDGNGMRGLRDAAGLIINDVLRVTRWGRVVALRHASLMPDSRDQYKRKLCVSASLRLVIRVRRGSARC
jgi:hypothetical protein